MAKIIKITEDLINEVRDDFELALEHSKMSDGKFEFKKSFDNIDEECIVYFEEKAYLKMQLLVQKFDKEIAWNGLAKRFDTGDGENEFIIYDILVYPQKVTGTTVTVDAEKEAEWKDSLPDEVFNHIRFQGHSHVNMGVSPSSTDTSQYKDYLTQLDPDDFYIFMIMNKKDEIYAIVYDMAANIMYENNDVNVVIAKDDDSIIDFLDDADDMVTTATYSYTYGKDNKFGKDSKPKSVTSKYSAYRDFVIDDDDDMYEYGGIDDDYMYDSYSRNFASKYHRYYGFD